MFLKKKEFTYSDNTIELFELSALQRIEYFDFLVEQAEKNEDVEKAEGIKKTALIIRANTESNAWLVSRSLAHGGSNDVEKIYNDVLSTWNPEALALAAKEVLVISGMAQTENTENENIHSDAQEESLEK
ncbi:phage tail assembly chaperone G [Proteus mirabilis]|uniref:phage tail assembly chaperone G n=1 Tax=Proteus mirabilis TaxID=584 RepID=UPI0006675067|nr:phage minor tail protein G [Proteus mirabilis]AVB30073.1 phage minor tail protein G [Proteus mirabilis]EKU2369927.1 phage minor tail protein G [Proteus mirabilis]EKU7917356.1 phage minor tail protein G [Proteus mirabilis]EKU7921374.1 phage minor tail protein G [Proteus mirabilis]EKU8688596.1 phage minor tail protein G [Proteus mirabilis]